MEFFFGLCLLFALITFVQNVLGSLYSVSLLKIQKKEANNNRQTLSSEKLTSYPGISVAVSLKGLSQPIDESIRSVLKQDYPGPIEYILVADDIHDPAFVRAEHIVNSTPSKVEVKWLTSFSAPLAGNPTTSKMTYGLNQAKYDWLFWQASDTHFKEDYFKNLVHSTRLDPMTFATSIPVQFGAKNFWSLLENVALALYVPFYFVLNLKVWNRAQIYSGAVFFSRELLNRAGGFGNIVNFLTEDAPLIELFTNTGGKLQVLPDFCFVRQELQSFREFYERQVRRMMIAKFYHPRIYKISYVYSSFWYLLFALIFQSEIFLWIFSLHLLAKIYQAYSYHVILDLSKSQLWATPLIALYELIAVVFTVHSYFEKTISWRGDVLQISQNGMVGRHQ